MASSPRGGAVRWVTVNPEEFQPLPGKEGGELRFILRGDPKTLNPVVAQETTSTAVIGDLFSGLTKLDLKTMTYVPDLAKRWHVLDNGRRYIFELRENLRWSDGHPISADDVVFTYRDVYLNPQIPNSTADMLKGVLKTPQQVRNFVRKLDEKRVEFRLPEPFAPFLGIMASPILPRHKLERYVKEGNFMSAWNVSTPPSQIVGSGPYRLVRYVKGQRVEYEANPYYYERDDMGKHLPYIKRKVGYILQDPDTALLMYTTGGVDMLSPRPQDLLVLSKLGGSSLYNLGPTPAITFLVFNQNPRSSLPQYKLRWFQNKLFRLAVSYAIDRESMCTLVYNGLAVPLYGPITPANRPYYKEGLFPQYSYSPQKAKELLLKAGFRYGKDGWLRDAEGHTVEIVLLTNADNKEREKLGNMIKEDLEKIGIKVIFRTLDFNTLVRKLSTPPYDWEAVIIGLTGSLDPHFGRNVWHSSGTLHIWNPMQKKTATQWEARVDALLDRAASTLDQKVRISLYQEAFRIIAEEQPMIFLVAPQSILSVSDRLNNVFPTVWGFYREESMFFK
ncbi:extracellular solute-binding protein family 5 [Thermocrinis albus DSM 14484]|uniref:Extracellular solute-binding protein family 5 n=1 Tax=Thermocrinis albus (strain DSM 14484 / JCM 11386 / HI 11/12) TaxID=638303 RepID=D3SPW4_THEAH|nr:ABC transporter substrate-binding protein [Thermocrinis albus]ADC89201.1 extracellular solute-binding protein family 5 [Thermocrinis albus DSM 14484]